MPRRIEKNAKSEEEAVRLAAEELGVTPGEVSYTIEREIGKGLLGKLLGREVIISAWITKEAEEEERLRRTREERRIRREEAAKAAAAAKAEKSAAAAKPKTEKPAAAKPKAEKKQPGLTEKPTEPAKVQHTDTAAAVRSEAEPPKAERPAKDSKKREVTEKSVKDAEYFVTELVHKMGLTESEVSAVNGGTAVDVTISGPKMGLIIGKRGDTLDAVQYLTSLYVNKEKNSYIKVNVDTEGYRSRREKTLIQLAHSLERRVQREGKPITLEPMSPNERRIIHAALQGTAGIKTYSVGEEPNRKLVVAPEE